MGFLASLFSSLLKGEANAPAVHSPEPQPDEWNRIGRAKAERVCRALEAIIERDEDVEEDDFTADERDEDWADKVLQEVAALNRAGRWQEARQRLDPAHTPFVSHMGDVGLSAVVILGPEEFLVRLGQQVLHLRGGDVEPLPDVALFAISRNRQWLVLATRQGLSVSAGLGQAPVHTAAWPEGMDIDPASLRSLDIANDGARIALASDQFGIWLVKNGVWTALAPRPGVGDEAAEDARSGEGQDDETTQPPIRQIGSGPHTTYIGSYAQLKARLSGPLGLDASHAAISPDGQHVAYGWQDAPGHYVDRITANALEPVGIAPPRSDYPYAVRFSDDSRHLLSNSRHMAEGITACHDIRTLASQSDDAASTDEYLRAYGMALLPGARFGLTEPVAWIGGAGWSHAAPLSGGKPVFTHFLGSALQAFDFDPRSGLVAVASASGVLHVLDPFQAAEAGRERGYRPRRELLRWIFWETLDKPIRW